jgi:hypothetical protein
MMTDLWDWIWWALIPDPLWAKVDTPLLECEYISFVTHLNFLNPTVNCFFYVSSRRPSDRKKRTKLLLLKIRYKNKTGFEGRRENATRGAKNSDVWELNFGAPFPTRKEITWIGTDYCSFTIEPR